MNTSRAPSSSAVVVRAVRADEYLRWRDLWDGYNAFYGRAGDSALPLEIVNTTWERFFDAREPMHALVAELDDSLVGLAHFLYHRSTILRHPICYLQDLFTLPSMRGRGVGRALIAQVYVQARAAGSSRVYWQTHESNRTAMRLYDRVAERSGFVVYRHSL